jgi:cation transport protein ChaC
MWVFGYGSLMWDGWEARYGGRRVRALLQGYRRVFNKPSTKRWGSAVHPGPTLNLESADGARCEGIAFAIDTAQAEGVRAYLHKREGNDFPLRVLPIQLEDGTGVEAEVPIYVGQVLPHRSIDDTVTRIRAARGLAGSCEHYVRAIAASLAELAIDDRAVTELVDALRARA